MNDQIVQKAEKSLAALTANHPDFFKHITSRPFKQGELQKCAKAGKLGNKLRSFASQQHSVSLSWQDPRLSLLVSQFKSFQEKRSQVGDAASLFKGKKVLDIGCHIGAVSLQIAAFYEPASVLGIDIDPKLIKTAIENLQRVVNAAQTKKKIAQSNPEEEEEGKVANGGGDMSMLTAEETKQ